MKSAAAFRFERDIKAGRLCPGMSFNEKVWALTARIPAGKVATYGQIARALKTAAYRAVGNALNRNPYAPAVPCHRVVGSQGALTGFATGLAKKRQLLAEEGITFIGGKVNLDAHLMASFNCLTMITHGDCRYGQRRVQC